MRSAVLLLTSVVICGCAAKPPEQPDPAPREIRRPERLVPLGIIHTERSTDVVTVPENAEYALFPNVSTAQAPRAGS